MTEAFYLSGNPDLNRGPLRPELARTEFNLVSSRFITINIQKQELFVKICDVKIKRVTFLVTRFLSMTERVKKN